MSVPRAIARENPLYVATIEGKLCPERMMHNKTIWSGKNDFSYAINGNITILSRHLVEPETRLRIKLIKIENMFDKMSIWSQ